MNFTDTQRLDFLEKWEVSSHKTSWFTLLTQHVQKSEYLTLRSFCDYSIDFENMIDENGLDILGWHSLTPDLQLRVVDLWKKEGRAMSDEEKQGLLSEFNRYWEDLHQTGSESQDK